MGTFDNTYGAEPMMASVAAALKEIKGDDIWIHTISLTLNGQHGEFDFVVEASDDSSGYLEDRKWQGVAHRYGGVAGFEEVEV